MYLSIYFYQKMCFCTNETILRKSKNNKNANGFFENIVKNFKKVLRYLKEIDIIFMYLIPA